MSSDHLENTTRPAADRFLILLKTRGPQTASDLGSATGVTGEAARQRLVRLAAEGLVEATSEPRGVGRPAQMWGLTAAGNARFPDAHAELTAQLIRSIRTQLGESALDRLIASRSAESKTAYEGALRRDSRPGREGRPAGRGADPGGIHGRVPGRGGRIRPDREPLPDLRGRNGLPGVLPGRARHVPRSVGAGRISREGRAHR